MPLNPATEAQISWGQLLRVDTGANEFEHNLHHAWAALDARPSVVRHGFAVPASKFWEYLSGFFTPTAENVVESADHGIDEDDRFVHNRYYMLHVADGLYLSCTEFTPEYDEDENENADMVERHVGDICLFYRYSQELAAEAEEISANLKSFRVEGHGERAFYALHPALGGYTLRHAEVPDDEIKIESHFGAKTAKQLEKGLAKGYHILVDGHEDFGGDILLRQAIDIITDAGHAVLYVPEFLYSRLGSVSLLQVLSAIQPAYIVLENAGKIGAGELAALESVLQEHNIRYVATVDDAKFQLGTKAATCRIATGKVPAETANALAAEVGLPANFTEDTSLADVYATSRKPARRGSRIGLSERHL